MRRSNVFDLAADAARTWPAWLHSRCFPTKLRSSTIQPGRREGSRRRGTPPGGLSLASLCPRPDPAALPFGSWSRPARRPRHR